MFTVLGLAVLGLITPATSGQPRHRRASSPLTIPAIRPGNTLAQVEALIRKADFEGASDHGLRSLNWHRTSMMIEVRSDKEDRVASVMFQYKNRVFASDDGVIIGRDTLSVAARKLGPRVVKRSKTGYVVDASCFGASIMARSKVSSDWLLTYEALECEHGDDSIRRLPGSPINNVTITAQSGVLNRQ